MSELGDRLEALIREIVREELMKHEEARPAPPPGAPETYSQAEFCKVAGISKTIAWRLRKQGKLGYYAPRPGKVRYTRQHLEDFIKSREKNRKE